MTTDRMPGAAPPGSTQPLWRRKPWLIPFIVVLVAALVAGLIALANRGDGDGGGSGGGDAGTFTPGGTGGGGGAGTTDHYQEVLAIITDTSGRPGAINTFWAQNFPTWWRNVTYQPPQIMSYRRGQVPNNACGRRLPDPKDWMQNAALCKLDRTIAYEDDFLRELFAVDDVGPAVVMAHEWMHYVQETVGIPEKYDISWELGADCGAGLYFQYAATQGMLDENDMANAAKTTYDGGNPDSIWFLQQDHGKPLQRWASLMAGVDGTIQNCYQISISPPAGATVLTSGPFEIPLLQEARATQWSGGGYQLNFTGTQATLKVRGQTEQLDPVQELTTSLRNVNITEPNLSALVLPTQDGTVERPLNELFRDETTRFAAAVYTFTANSMGYAGIGLVASTNKGTFRIFAEAPLKGRYRDQTLDVLTFLTLVGIN